MPRDYAKYKPKQPKPKRVEQGWHQRLLLLILLVCVLVALVFGFYVYKNNASDSLRQKTVTFIAEMHSRFSHKKMDVIAKTTAMQRAPQEPEVRFNFYTELPQMQVTLTDADDAPSAAAIAKRAMRATNTQAESTAAFAAPAQAEASSADLKKQDASAENKTQYIVQVGLFKNETAAGETRVSLLLAGFEVDTVKTTDDAAHTTLYRLQKGPYATLSQAKLIQKQLLKKGVLGVVKQL